MKKTWTLLCHPLAIQDIQASTQDALEKVDLGHRDNKETKIVHGGFLLEGTQNEAKEVNNIFDKEKSSKQWAGMRGINWVPTKNIRFKNCVEDILCIQT